MAGLLEEIVDVDLRDLAVIAGVDIVPAKQEVNIVGQRVVGAAEEGLRVVADVEVITSELNLELVNLLERRLPDVHAARSTTLMELVVGPRESLPC